MKNNISVFYVEKILNVKRNILNFNNRGLISFKKK